MGCDVRHGPARQRGAGPLGTLVRGEATGVDARLDAVKHVGSISASGSKTCAPPQAACCPPSASTGPGDVRELGGLPARGPQRCSSLHFHLHQASVSDGNVDLSRLWENTLTASIQNCPSPSSKTTTRSPRTIPGLHSGLLVQGGRLRYADPPERGWGALRLLGDLLGTPRPATCLLCVSSPSSWTCASAAIITAQRLQTADVVGFSAKVGRTCQHGLRRHPLRPSRRRPCVKTYHAERGWECLIGSHPSVRVAEDGTLTGTVSDGGA